MIFFVYCVNAELRFLDLIDCLETLVRGFFVDFRMPWVRHFGKFSYLISVLTWDTVLWPFST